MDTVKFTPRKLAAMLLLSITLPGLLLLFFVQISFTSDLHGLYILKGTNGKLLQIKDDILLGEYERLLFHVNMDKLSRSPKYQQRIDQTQPYFNFMWKKQNGDGYIESHFPDKTQFILCFGRFLDSDGKAPSGLFVGGGLPLSRYADETVKMNETGMAYHDGSRWYHLWCNANESIASSSGKTVYPSFWQFRGGSVVYHHDHEIILESKHRVSLDGAPFDIDRYAFYTAGDRHFYLLINIKNRGTTPAAYYYLYGDEPWVGDFGSSTGNVGWLKDRPFYFEGAINTTTNDFAGMHDVGNPYTVGRTAKFTGVANFIDWSLGVRPNLGYFSNKMGAFAQEKEKIPLYDKQNRIIMLQWGPRMLQPGQSETIILAIGMADKIQGQVLPARPALHLDMNVVDLFLKTH